jgi:hypothetical protein
MKAITENVIEKYLFKRATALGVLCIKFKPTRRGWPDRSLYWPGGVHHLVELKRPKGGKYEPLQLRTHTRLRALGHPVMVILTKEGVDDYIKRFTCGQ